MIRIIGAVLLAVSLAACASPFKSPYNKPDGRVLIVSQRDWADFQTYLSKIGPTHRGAFAMGVYGDRSDGWADSYCAHDVCYGGKGVENAAMDYCRQAGGLCVLFARNRDILVNYKVEDQ